MSCILLFSRSLILTIAAIIHYMIHGVSLQYLEKGHHSRERFCEYGCDLGSGNIIMSCTTLFHRPLILPAS